MTLALSPQPPLARPLAASVWGEARALLRLGLPLAVAQLGIVLMITTDTIMLGWLGPEALAAGALGFSVIIVPTMVLVGIAIGTAPLMAFALGRRLHHVREVRRTVRQGLWAVALAGLPVLVLLLRFEPILLWFGHRPALAADTAAYVAAVAPTALTSAWFVVLRSFTATYGRPREAVAISLLQVLLNAVLVYGLVFGAWGLPRLGVVGAGLASTLSGVIALAALAGFLSWDRRFRRFHLFGRLWRADWVRLADVFRIGLPIGLALLFEILLFSGAAQMMGLIGPLELAAHQIALQIASGTFMCALGIGQAGGIRVGLAAGAGRPEAIGRTGWTALALGVGFMGSMGLVMVLAPEALVALFLADLSSPENRVVLGHARTFLLFAALFQAADATQVIMANVLRGLKDTRAPLAFACVGYWLIGLPACWLFAFPLGLGGPGIWLGILLGLALVALALVARFTRRAAIPAYRQAFGP